MQAITLRMPAVLLPPHLREVELGCRSKELGFHINSPVGH